MSRACKEVRPAVPVKTAANVPGLPGKKSYPVKANPGAGNTPKMKPAFEGKGAKITED